MKHPILILALWFYLWSTGAAALWVFAPDWIAILGTTWILLAAALTLWLTLVDLTGSGGAECPRRKAGLRAGTCRRSAFLLVGTHPGRSPANPSKEDPPFGTPLPARRRTSSCSKVPACPPGGEDCITYIDRNQPIRPSRPCRNHPRPNPDCEHCRFMDEPGALFHFTD